MVADETERKESIINLIRKWVAELPENVAQIAEEILPWETVVKIRPSNPKASSIEFRISDYGTFDVYLGEGIRFEEAPLSSDLVLDICESVRRGCVREKAWEWRGKIVRSDGELELSSGRWSDTSSNHWAGLFRLGKVRIIEYAPYLGFQENF